MNRPEFSRSIQDIKPEEIMKNKFKQVMALYDLVGQLDDIIVQGTTDDDDISFLVTFNTKKASIEFVNAMDSVTSFSIYGDRFRIITGIEDDKCVSIKLELM